MSFLKKLEGRVAARKNKKGFTLVELVIVIAVLAIVAGIAIATVPNVIKNANASADKSNAQTIEMAIKTFESENLSYNTNPSEGVDKIMGGNAGNMDATTDKKIGDLLKVYGVNPESVGLASGTNLKQGSDFHYYIHKTLGTVVAAEKAPDDYKEIKASSLISIDDGRVDFS